MYLVSFDFYWPSKCGSYFCRTLYVVVRVNADSLLSLVPVLQRLRASWPRARALPPCFVSTTVHACRRHRALPLQLPRYLHKLTSQNNHTTPHPFFGSHILFNLPRGLSFALQLSCRSQFDSLPEQRFSGVALYGLLLSSSLLPRVRFALRFTALRRRMSYSNNFNFAKTEVNRDSSTLNRNGGEVNL